MFVTYFDFDFKLITISGNFGDFKLQKKELKSNL